MSGKEVLPKYYREEPELQERVKELFREYVGIQSDEEIVRHVKEIREKAWQLFNYPCIGGFMFLEMQIKDHPLANEVITRMKTGKETFLDLGCCFAQDIRSLVFEGAPSDKMTAFDLRREFVDFGYELFRDRESLKAEFVFGDFLDGQGGQRSAERRLPDHFVLHQNGLKQDCLSIDQVLDACTFAYPVWDLVETTSKLRMITAPIRVLMLSVNGVASSRPRSWVAKSPATWQSHGPPTTVCMPWLSTHLEGIAGSDRLSPLEAVHRLISCSRDGIRLQVAPALDLELVSVAQRIHRMFLSRAMKI
ncbi:hypothetical protein M409DRAFT_53844 [Zasmidium cellare ATCC 36951]|uniref:Methyltransferase domain-containing protein n=1 Tax=Zasmidium cellare ATCC 36951 TaxID=1080233 RepID=A0A6A6CL04_ZASCE|nr:uncharacterized protein M409DRAFT_53844 [Zasmidium cellare ATCC 36951]KAF2167894.1 hypothetical protein M409DRAFT_53844 [Zasmidium cellare ATCC 36951]